MSRVMSIDMFGVASRLVRAGYNVLFVNEQKMPVGIDEYRQYYAEHMSEDFIMQYIENVRKRARGIALMGTINPNYPEKVLVIIDVDNPWAWDEVMSELSEGIKQKLESTWKWLSGPRCPRDRGKHGITCDTKTGTCVHRPSPNEQHEFSLNEARRGFAYAVLIPKGCIPFKEGHRKFMGDAVELRVRAYEVIPPSMHPSGVQYEWVNPPFDINDPNILYAPQELTCDEVKQLLSVIGYGKERPTTEVGGLGKRTCVEEVVIPEDRLDKAVELLSEVYVPGFRDNVLFGLIGALWHRCVGYESAKKLVDILYAWASKVYSDESAYKDYYTLDWVYGRRGGGGEERRVWGKPRLYDTLVQVFKGKGLSEEDAKVRANDFLNELFDTLGLKRGVRFMARISKGGKVGGRNTIAYVANDPRLGIIILYKRLPNEKKLREYAGNECLQEAEQKLGNAEEEDIKRFVRECIDAKLNDSEFINRASRELADYDYDIVVKDWYVSKAKVIEDPYTGNEYYTIVFKNQRRRKAVKLTELTLDEIVRFVIKRLGSPVPENTLRTVLIFLITEMAKRKRRPTFTGVVFDKNVGRLKVVYGGPYKKNMRELMTAQGDPRAFIELVTRWYGNDPKVWDSFAIGMFQIFNFARKQANVIGVARNKALVMVGEPLTGKSTIAGLIVKTIFNHPDMDKNASILFSTARLARYVSRSTVPFLANDAKQLYDNRIADVFKSLITEDVPVYEVAIPYAYGTLKYMGVSGLIITAQKFIETDPGVIERTHKVLYTARDKKDPEVHAERTKAFLEWVEEHTRDLMAFGRLYIETAINEWDKVKDVLLFPDYVRAAREYLTYVVSKLGATPTYPAKPDRAETEEEFTHYYIDEFRAIVKEVIDRARGYVDSRDKPITDILDELTRNRVIEGISPVLDGDTVIAYKVRRSLLSKAKTDIESLAQLYEGLKRELAQHVMCVDELLRYDQATTKDKHGVYMYVAKPLMAFILQEIDEVMCDEGNEHNTETEGEVGMK